jgi:hypothetical protein
MNMKGESLDHLLKELNLRTGAAPGRPAPADDNARDWFDHVLGDVQTQKAAARQLGDDRQERILRRTEEWLRFLNSQAAQATKNAEALYQRILEAAEHSADLKEVTLALSAAEMIDQLEWILSGVEHWIEAVQPDNESAQFVVEWKDGDGHARWSVNGEDVTERESLRAIVEDVAAMEGTLPPFVTAIVSEIIVTELRASTLDLMRLKPVLAGPQETTYELIPRGEGFPHAIDVPEESAARLPAEVEATLGAGASARLAELLDDVAYEAVEHRCGSAVRTASAGASRDSSDGRVRQSQPVPGLVRLRELVSAAAESCTLAESTIVESLIVVARVRIQTAEAGGNSSAATYYGRLLNALWLLRRPQERT